jgi:NAD(P)-dependent dehydrogenase (short-subunit alcohol dehydrogenase family)
MLTEFKGRTAVVTGAASGIGKAIVGQALELGMSVIAGDVDKDGLAQLTACHSGQPLGTITVDVTDSDQVRRMADFSYDRFGDVGLLCNNAGTAATGSAWELEPKAWRWIMDVNFMGAVHGVHHFVPRMLAGRRDGAVVNTGSMASVIASANLGAYCASKHALYGMSESLMLDLKARAAPISVSLLCPGFVKTDIMNKDRHPSGIDVIRDDETQVALTKGIAAGIEPALVAQILFESIAKGDFWIFPQREFLPAVAKRSRRMLEATQFRDE